MPPTSLDLTSRQRRSGGACLRRLLVGRGEGRSPLFDPSPIHIVLLLGILLLVFGTKRLPEIGRSLGRGIWKLKGSVTGHEDEPRPASPRESPATAPPRTGPVAADEALSHLSRREAVAAHQATPAPTPAIAVAEEAARPTRRGR